MSDLVDLMISVKGLTPFFGQICVFFILVLVITHYLSHYLGRLGSSSVSIAKQFNIIRRVSKIGAILSFIVFLGFAFINLAFSV